MKKSYHLPILFLFLLGWLGAEAGTAAVRLHLNTPRSVYAEEEYIFLPLLIENITSETVSIVLPYLQPREKKRLFVGQDFTLMLMADDQPVASFTNHMPPEPKPGSFRVDLAPGESISWSIPFPYDYYPVRLPCSFRVRLLWQRIESNEVTFQVLASTGTVNKTELLVNSDFSEGETFPCGWRIEHQTIFWNKQEKLLHFLLDVPTATGEGLWVYSLLRPIKTPGSFTLHLKAKSSGPEIIVFVEGWGLVAGRRRRLERNECFAHPATPDWETYRFNVVFSKPEVKLVRIRLFAYGRAGSVWFRKVCLTPAD